MLLNDPEKTQNSFPFPVCEDHRVITKITLVTLAVKLIESLKQFFSKSVIVFNILDEI